MKKKIGFFIILFAGLLIAADSPYARRIRPFVGGFPGSCIENEVGYDMTGHTLGICTNAGYQTISIGTSITNSAGANVFPLSDGTNLITSVLSQSGTTTKTVNVAGNFAPTTTGVRNLGSTTLSFANLYLGNATARAQIAGNAITIDRIFTLPDETGTFCTTGSVCSGYQASGTYATSVNNLSFFSSTTSAQLLSVISDETGTGALVFGTIPTFTTSIKTPAITSPADSATALQIFKADGSTIVGDFDSTNINFGLGTTSPSTIASISGLTNNITVKNASGVARFIAEGTTQAGFLIGTSSSSADQKLFQFVKDSSTGLSNLRALSDTGGAVPFNFFTMDHATGNIAIGKNSAASALFTVGSSEQFKVTSAGAISGLSSTVGFVQQTATRCFLASDQTTTSTTFANITGCSVTVTSGRKYTIRVVLYLSDSTAADGAKIDFNGGSATATNFRMHCTAFDTALNLSSQGTALSTAYAASTFTGNGMFECYGAFEPSSTSTFIPRIAQNAHTVGTLTLARGSHLLLEDMP